LYDILELIASEIGYVAEAFVQFSRMIDQDPLYFGIVLDHAPDQSQAILDFMLFKSIIGRNRLAEIKTSQ
jgi:hypothetical protein